jgi:hypothetical protein
MSGIYFCLSILAIFVIVRWVIAADRAGPDKSIKGLLAIKDNQSSSERKRHRAPR